MPHAPTRTALSLPAQLDDFDRRIAELQAMAAEIRKEKGDLKHQSAGAESVREVNNMLLDCLIHLDHFV